MSVTKRLQQYIRLMGIKVSHIEREIGYSNGALATQLRNNKVIGVDKIENLLIKYPDINPVWLLRGEGSMFLDSEEQPKQSASVEVNNHSSKIDHQQNYNDEKKVVYSVIQDKERIIVEKNARLEEKERHIAANERYIRILERQLARYEQAESLSN